MTDVTASPPRRVLVTGALGFIGGAVADRYRSLGAEVLGIDLRADPARGVAEGDTARPGAWQDALQGCDVVVHTAAVVSFRADPDGSVWRTNVLGTRNVLAAAARAAVGRVVHLSSVTAFGFDFPDGADESWPVRCNGVPYVDTKVAGEQVVLMAHARGEVECTVIRPGDVYGPRSRPWTVLPVEMLKRRRFLLPDGGRGVFSPCYVDNLVDAVVLAASQPQAAGEVLTASDGVAVSCGEFFGHYARMLGMDAVPTVPAAALRAMAAASSLATRALRQESELNAAAVDYFLRRGTYSIARARGLGYAPRVDLADGMARTERWLREQSLL